MLKESMNPISKYNTYTYTNDSFQLSYNSCKEDSFKFDDSCSEFMFNLDYSELHDMLDQNTETCDNTIKSNKKRKIKELSNNYITYNKNNLSLKEEDDFNVINSSSKLEINKENLYIQLVSNYMISKQMFNGNENTSILNSNKKSNKSRNNSSMLNNSYLSELLSKSLKSLSEKCFNSNSKGSIILVSPKNKTISSLSSKKNNSRNEIFRISNLSSKKNKKSKSFYN